MMVTRVLQQGLHELQVLNLSASVDSLKLTLALVGKRLPEGEACDIAATLLEEADKITRIADQLLAEHTPAEPTRLRLVGTDERAGLAGPGAPAGRPVRMDA